MEFLSCCAALAPSILQTALSLNPNCRRNSEPEPLPQEDGTLADFGVNAVCTHLVKPKLQPLKPETRNPKPLNPKP